jgi:hypothetical protein
MLFGLRSVIEIQNIHMSYTLIHAQHFPLDQVKSSDVRQSKIMKWGALGRIAT